MKVIRRNSVFYLMMLPIIGYFLLFTYYPLVRGFILSFQKFRVFGNRPFIGLLNYKTVLTDPSFWQMLVNTLWIGGATLIIGFAAALIVALSLNEVMQTWFKKLTQMIIYLPHLFSWVVVAGLWIFMLSPDYGFANDILKWLGHPPIHFMGEEAYARWVIVASSIWKESGFTCILYLAAIVSINPALFEAARIDGANRWQLVRYVTLPQLVPTMKVVLVLSTLGVLRIFDQILAMKNAAIERSVDVIMMYTYEKGILKFDMGVANAAGILILIATLILTLAIRKATRYDEG